MHPVLFELAGKPVYSYGVAVFVTLLLVLRLVVRRSISISIDTVRALDLTIYASVAAPVGQKLATFVASPSFFLADVRSFSILGRVTGDHYGAALAGFVTIWWFTRQERRSWWLTADMLAPAVALGIAGVRVGCFLAGCDYGRQTDVPWAVMFTDERAADLSGTPLGVLLHPVQLYEAAAAFVIGVILLATERRRRFAGHGFWCLALLYAVSRFVTDLYRGDDRGMVLGLSVPEFVSLCLIPLSVVMLIRLRTPRVATEAM